MEILDQMYIRKISQFSSRAIRYIFTDRSYSRYYAPETWSAKYASGYDLSVPKEDGRYGVLLKLIRRYECEPIILDAGCGDGILEQLYRPLSDARLVGIDSCAIAIQKARDRGLDRCEFHCADFADFQMEERCSVLVLNEALYYVPDPVATMMDLATRLLRETGVFIVSMFDTPITLRIWKAVLRHHAILQGVAVRDEVTGQSWHIRVLRPVSSEWRL